MDTLHTFRIVYCFICTFPQAQLFHERSVRREVLRASSSPSPALPTTEDDGGLGQEGEAVRPPPQHTILVSRSR